MSLTVNKLTTNETIERFIDRFERMGPEKALQSFEVRALTKSAREVITCIISNLSQSLSSEKKETLRKDLRPFFLSARETVLEDEHELLPKIFGKLSALHLLNVALVNRCFSRAVQPLLRDFHADLLDTRSRLSESDLFPYFFQFFAPSERQNFLCVNYHVYSTSRYWIYERLQKKKSLTLNQIYSCHKVLRLEQDDYANLFRNCHQLKKLDVIESSNSCTLKMIQQMIPHLKHCPQLTELDFTQFIAVTDSATTYEEKVICVVHAIKACPHLASLDLSHCDLLRSEEIQQILKGAGSLTHLNLQGCTSSSLGNAALRGLSAKCPKLTFLNLDYVRITDACIAHLPSTLQDLRLNGDGPRITDNGVSKLISRCPFLTTLLLNAKQQITANGLASLTQLSHLKTLNLDSCSGITDLALVAFLKTMPLLSSLTPNCRSFVRGDFEKLAPALKNIKSLTLIFASTRTQELLDSLNQCSKLEELNLHFCSNLSKSEIKKKYPNLKISSK
jgi:hypothetical protein